MKLFKICIVFLFVLSPAVATVAQARTLRVVVWNIENATVEKVATQSDDIQNLGRDLRPDILVLEEVSGGAAAAQAVANALGWTDAYIAVSDFFPSNTEKPYYSQELAIISKVPIVSIIEYDARPDGNTVPVTGPDGFRLPVQEENLTADGISGFGGGISRYAKGTIRVDLAGGISLFPVHLKSDRITKKTPDAITKTRIRNAQKREVTIAAISREAGEAVSSGRTSVILGDFNATFEPGKFGAEVADCRLQDFPNKPMPFPPSACTGPGYDDTLGILESGLVENTHWTFLTRKLNQTWYGGYRTWLGASNNYGDFAIDHVAVPVEQSSQFGAATRAADLYGSDHWPIIFEVQVSD